MTNSNLNLPSKYVTNKAALFVITYDPENIFPDREYKENDNLLSNLNTINDEQPTEFDYLEVLDIFERPLIRPNKKEYKVKLRIKSISKGRPSVCDEVEHW